MPKPDLLADFCAYKNATNREREGFQQMRNLLSLFVSYQTAVGARYFVISETENRTKQVASYKISSPLLNKGLLIFVY